MIIFAGDFQFLALEEEANRGVLMLLGTSSCRNAAITSKLTPQNSENHNINDGLFIVVF